jgi:hypothetical protein
MKWYERELFGFEKVFRKAVITDRIRSHIKALEGVRLRWLRLMRWSGTRTIADIPLAVVTAAKGVLPGHPELQRELALLSEDSVHFAVWGGLIM